MTQRFATMPSPFVLGLALLLAACSGAPPPTPSPSASPDDRLVPVLVSSEISVGQNRLLFSLFDGQNRPLSAPDVPVTLHFAPPAGAGCTPQDGTGQFLAVEERATGLYRTEVSFDCAGDWTADISAVLPAGERSARVSFTVREASSTPAIGEEVPATDNPTADSAEDIALISTDDDPDPDFYRSTAADATGAGRPFVIVFATPAFCRTRACGPTLDLVKSAAVDFKERLTFIHVEPYELDVRDGVLQPVLDANGELVTVESVIEWGLLSEPYVFVVDSEARLVAKFEGVAAEDELVEAFEAAAG